MHNFESIFLLFVTLLNLDFSYIFPNKDLLNAELSVKTQQKTNTTILMVSQHFQNIRASPTTKLLVISVVTSTVRFAAAVVAIFAGRSCLLIPVVFENEKIESDDKKQTVAFCFEKKNKKTST